MKQRYANWIEQNVIGDGYGQCAQVTEAMVKTFPSLCRVRGWYHCPIWGERTHWWCAEANGEIVDPTASQFPSKGVMGTYQEYDGRPLQTGVCPNCGDPVYDDGYVCGPDCEQAYVAYIMSGEPY